MIKFIKKKKPHYLISVLLNMRIMDNMLRNLIYFLNEKNLLNNFCVEIKFIAKSFLKKSVTQITEKKRTIKQ